MLEVLSDGSEFCPICIRTKECERKGSEVMSKLSLVDKQWCVQGRIVDVVLERKDIKRELYYDPVLQGVDYVRLTINRGIVTVHCVGSSRSFLLGDYHEERLLFFSDNIFVDFVSCENLQHLINEIEDFENR